MKPLLVRNMDNLDWLVLGLGPRRAGPRGLWLHGLRLA